MSFYRLGIMLYIETQKGKEAMNKSDFQQKIRGTTAHIKRRMKVTNRCGKMKSKDIEFDDSWFSGVKNLKRVCLRE